MLFGKNLGKSLSLDETSLSNGELYTILTNKDAHGKKGSIVAIVKGTKAQNVIDVINKIAKKRRRMVKEITVDMAGSMNKIAKRCFPKAEIVTDRFHVQKLASDAVQEVRIKIRWSVMEAENTAISNARKMKIKYVPEISENGDTEKQLLARSRYLLFKPKSRWTKTQIVRAKILFKKHPKIESAYKLSQGLTYIFENNTDKGVARAKLSLWYDKVVDSGFKSFNTIWSTIEIHYESILNYFNNRSTNASAESFNAKLKEFRAHFRGVSDIEFFLFRLTKIYA